MTGPGLMSREPLAEGTERDARPRPVVRLRHGGVNDEAVEPHGKLTVRVRLQRFRRECEGVAERCKRLGGHEVLPVDMSNGCRLTNVTVERFARLAERR